MSRNAMRIINQGDGGYHMSKNDVSEVCKAARKLKGIYDFSHFKRKNDKQKSGRIGK